MISESETRERLARYLANEISLDEFEDWLVQASWDAHLDSEQPAQRLAYAIELKLAEFSSGHLREEELREELRLLAEERTVCLWGGPQPAVVTSTGTSTAFTFRAVGLGQPVSIRPSAVSA